MEKPTPITKEYVKYLDTLPQLEQSQIISTFTVEEKSEICGIITDSEDEFEEDDTKIYNIFDLDMYPRFSVHLSFVPRNWKLLKVENDTSFQFVVIALGFVFMFFKYDKETISQMERIETLMKKEG